MEKVEDEDEDVDEDEEEDEDEDEDEDDLLEPLGGLQLLIHESLEVVLGCSLVGLLVGHQALGLLPQLVLAEAELAGEGRRAEIGERKSFKDTEL